MKSSTTPAPADTVAAGAVYVFALDPNSAEAVLHEKQKLVASDRAASDEFGSGVALSGTAALVGAPGNNTGSGATGAVYFFSLTSGTQSASQSTETQKLAATDATPLDEFGSSVALSGKTALVGAPLDDIVVTDDKGNNTVFTNAGSVYTFVQTPLTSACTMKTDYATASCSGTFIAASLTELDQYVTEDFGRKGGQTYQNLAISGNLTNVVLNIQSPCQITLDNGISLSGDVVNIDGRQGVDGTGGFQNIDALETVCVLSEQDHAELGANSFVQAGALTLQAAKTAKIGGNATINLGGDLVIVSTGDSSSSIAILDSGSVVTAGSIKLQAPREAQLGQDTIVTADSTISLVSTGTTSSSQAGVQSGAQVAATDLRISSPREAIIGQNAMIILSGNLTMEAAQCSIDGSASVTYGSKTGNCL
jgi:hypothetical protein